MNTDLIPAINAACSRFFGDFAITEEDPEGAIASFITGRYFDLSVPDRRTFDRCLSMLGLGQVALALQGQRETSKDTRFSCGVLGTVVVSPCTYGRCRLHVPDTPEGLNCLLGVSEQGPMDVEDISEVLGKDQSDVRDTLLRAMRKMRTAAVHVAKQGADLTERFVMLHSLRVCGTCEQEIVGEPHNVEYGVAFCSVECCISPPVSHTVIESRTGIPAAEVIAWCLRQFDSPELAAQALAFPPSVLSDAIRA